MIAKKTTKSKIEKIQFDVIDVDLTLSNLREYLKEKITKKDELALILIKNNLLIYKNAVDHLNSEGIIINYKRSNGTVAQKQNNYFEVFQKMDSKINKSLQEYGLTIKSEQLINKAAKKPEDDIEKDKPNPVNKMISEVDESESEQFTDLSTIDLSDFEDIDKPVANSNDKTVYSLEEFDKRLQSKLKK